MVTAVIADTHLPRGARRLPPRCLELIANSDALIHAGDVVRVEAWRQLEAIGLPVHAIHGNADEPALRRQLPAELTLNLNGHQIAVVHDAGPSRGRLERLRRRFPDAQAVIFGHSHMPLHEKKTPQIQGAARGVDRYRRKRTLPPSLSGTRYGGAADAEQQFGFR